MFRELTTGLVFCALAWSARPAAAEELDTAMYDTVDSFEFGGRTLTVTGIIRGDSAPSTSSFFIEDVGDGARCDRLLMMVMSKPGKFQFGVVRPPGISRGCTLILRTL